MFFVRGIRQQYLANRRLTIDIRPALVKRNAPLFTVVQRYQYSSPIFGQHILLHMILHSLPRGSPTQPPASPDFFKGRFIKALISRHRTLRLLF